VIEAYEALGDDSKRKDYDSMRKYEASQSLSSSSRTSSSYSNFSNTSYPNSRKTSNARSPSSNNNQQYQHYYRDPTEILTHLANNNLKRKFLGIISDNLDRHRNNGKNLQRK